MRATLHRLQRRATDKVVVELHERAIAKVIGRQVVILDIVRDEAAADRAGRLVAVGRQPVAVGAHRVASIDGRQRRRNPPGFQRVGGIGSAADLPHPKGRPGGNDGRANFLALGIGAEHLQPRLARHAVTQGTHLAARDGDPVKVEELDLGQRPAVQHLKDRLGLGPLDLIAIVAAADRFAHRARGRAVVALCRYFPAAGFRVELDPGDGRRAAHQQELFLCQPKADHIADDMAGRTAWHIMLGLADREIGERVDGQVFQHGKGIGAGHPDFRHVVRLVKQHRRFAPRALFVAPVGKLGRHYGVDISADLRIAQHLNGVAGLGQNFGKRLG
ncbi:hypothetical protein GALL_487530 [mine drainage metagenome]|uniref:Uncharacterized protein n=1 Tax=mine drainage metagenome TaxID=410659 RepID=A0A1J5Q193_9ZZZZ